MKTHVIASTKGELSRCRFGEGEKIGALAAFVYESNKTGQVVFADTIEKAVELLR